MSNDMRNLVDGLLAYALRFAGSDDKPASGDCWDLIAQARRYLVEMERQQGRGAAAPDAVADGETNGEAIRARGLEALRRDGLTIGECIRAFAAPDDDPYVAAAREAVDSNDDVRLDEPTATARAEGGAWVLSWRWISDRQAGVLSHSEMLEEVWRRAGALLTGTHGLDDDTAWLRNNQVLWLDAVSTRFSQEIDGIEAARSGEGSGQVVWVDERRCELRFVPSEAVLQLLGLARRAGLKRHVAEHCARFCSLHGRALDALLASVPLR